MKLEKRSARDAATAATSRPAVRLLTWVPHLPQFFLSVFLFVHVNCPYLLGSGQESGLSEGQVALHFPDLQTSPYLH